MAHARGHPHEPIVGGVDALDALQLAHALRQQRQAVRRDVQAHERLELVDGLRQALQAVVLKLRGAMPGSDSFSAGQQRGPTLLPSWPLAGAAATDIYLELRLPG